MYLKIEVLAFILTLNWREYDGVIQILALPL